MQAAAADAHPSRGGTPRAAAAAATPPGTPPLTPSTALPGGSRAQRASQARLDRAAEREHRRPSNPAG
jgi:hypothetical protein